VDGQTNVAIHVLQGERELAQDNRSLARFDLKGIPTMAAGLPRIEVRFLIDANGILQVTAREQRSGREAEIEVKPTYGLTDDQVESMILDSFDHAEEDFAKRQLAEALVEADTITQAVQKGKASGAWDQLSDAEQNTVAHAEQQLGAARAGKSYKEVRDAIEVLNKATTRLAELMMDSAVSRALHGKTMEGAGEELGEGPESPHPIAPAEIK
jgi:molecular chaperone DnaK (HSP70)